MGRPVGLVDIMSNPTEQSFSKRLPGAPLQNLSKFHVVPFTFVTPPPFEQATAVDFYSTLDDLSCSFDTDSTIFERDIWTLI